MPARLFALVDCNNFYCSCERVFNPGLGGQPVVVLSNNDGCVIARSEEAKKLGLAMGTPLFKIRDLIQRHGVRVFSSNYVLYGDMSHRVMQTLRTFAPLQEVYSIDESFIELTGLDPADEPALLAYAQKIRATVRQHTGIPVSVGLGSTKVLAKAANKLAKRLPQFHGALTLTRPDADALLAQLPCADVWGVGRRFTAHLAAHGITNALELKHAPAAWVRQTMGVVGERLVWELNGLSCLALEEVAPARQNLCCSRSFGKLITAKAELKEAVASYVCRAAEKLRADKSVVSALQVFLLTNPFRPDPQYTPQITLTLPVPTSYTPTLITHALRLVERMFRPGYNYHKAGVLLCGLLPEAAVEPELFASAGDNVRTQAVSQAIDTLNRKLGRDTVHFAAQGFTRDWKLRANRRSPAFTTRWSDLLQIHL